MAKFTTYEIERLTDGLANLSRNMNNDIVDNLDLYCNNLRDLFQGLHSGSYECEKIHSFNTMIHNLQEDTFRMRNEIEVFISNAEIIYDGREQ